MLKNLSAIRAGSQSAVGSSTEQESLAAEVELAQSLGSVWEIMREPLRLLVAEDDQTEVLLLRRAFSKAGVNVPIEFVRDGQEALDYFQGCEPRQDRAAYPLPTVLLLDLKMPRLNGFDVLKWIRQQPGLRRLLVVVFSSSAETEDINRAYDLGANSYVRKPHHFEELQGLAKSIENYWLKTNLPPVFLTE